jgi:Uma2 family endonuclease
MATVTTTRPLTIEEFERRYAASDRALEFWHGEVVEKAVPTWLHSVLQMILAETLCAAGYKAGPEVDLRLDREFAPRPDVMAGRQSITTRYPTQPSEVEIVVEILSPEDTMSRLLAKCDEYVRIGIEQVYVADPESETAWFWNRERGQLDRVETWTLTNGRTIALADIWRQLHERR